jgi:FAD/FMN-containing dehydrogenase
VIVEISLKLRAKFARTATAIGRFPSAEAVAACLSLIRGSALQPVSCEWIGPDNEIWLRFGEDSRAVEWQLKNLPEGTDWVVSEGVDEKAAWEKLRKGYHALGPVVLRVVGLPTAVREIIEEYRPAAWIAHAMNGIVLLQVSSAEEIVRIRQKYRAVIERAPLEIRREVPTFGLTGAEFDLTKRMKEAFDPEGRLNPGRHADGERR